VAIDVPLRCSGTPSPAGSPLSAARATLRAVEHERPPRTRTGRALTRMRTPPLQSPHDEAP
jgi:hypothetical protein